MIRKGVGLRPAYLPQQVHFANPHRNLIDTLIYDKNVSMQVARNRLGSFQFTGEQQMKTVGNAVRRRKKPLAAVRVDV